jgi:argininosuccinate lyase
MVLREGVLSVATAALALRRSLLDVAALHTRTGFPAHTHAQPAQPTTVAHYLLAVIEELERSATRLVAAYRTTNCCPLGACAITGTGFPIDRQRTSDLLGFARPTGNTYGSIATVDYLLESAAAAAGLVVGLGRFAQDLLLWSTVEVGYLRLPDGLVQISSIMPQKRNPVALEHARALLSRAWAELTAASQVPHNTPFGDIVDTEDDLQPLVHGAFRNATRAVSLLAVTLASAEFDVEKMGARAAGEWVTVTELADTLVRDHGLSFGAAHAIVTSVVQEARRSGGPATAASLVSAARQHGHEIACSDTELAQILSPVHFVEVRRTHGGPAPAIVAAALATAESAFVADQAALAALRQDLEDAARRRQQTVAAL